jgi:prevent-host-death family protein
MYSLLSIVAGNGIVYTHCTLWVHAMTTISVGIREFRARLAEYLLESDKPVAVTRHGETIGYFIPARAARKELDRVALKKAVSKMDEMLQREGLTDTELDELTKDFRAWRKARK